MTTEKFTVQRFHDAVAAARTDAQQRQDSLPIEMDVPFRLAGTDVVAADPALTVEGVRRFLLANNGEGWKTSVEDDTVFISFFNE